MRWKGEHISFGLFLYPIDLHIKRWWWWNAPITVVVGGGEETPQ
jgi:hypothetical protein